MQNDTKERFINLIQDSVNGCARNWAAIIADNLIANGAILTPCKVGDTIYAIGNGGIKETVVSDMMLEKETCWTILLTYNCDEACEKCPFSSWSRDHNGEYSCEGEFGSACVPDSDFGKTIFLSKEDAEDALRKGSA